MPLECLSGHVPATVSLCTYLESAFSPNCSRSDWLDLASFSLSLHLVAKVLVFVHSNLILGPTGEI